jgi:hypothetical protein
MSDFGVALFHTTSAALRAEKTIHKAGLTGKLIPTPRQYSSDCGFALRFDWTLAEQVRELLTRASVEIAGLHPLS